MGPSLDPNQAFSWNICLKCVKYNVKLFYDLQIAEVLPRVLSMDGNFCLVRKKSAGTSNSPRHHDGNFFLPDIEENHDSAPERMAQVSK